MRKEFASLLLKEIEKNKNIVLITGDLGFGLWDSLRSTFPDNFINAGSSEQLMIGMATGLSLSGKIPIVYSITPFLLYRPFEFIRNYLHYEKIPVKLLGGGRERDYGKLGYTHWAEEDQQVIKILHNIVEFRPDNDRQLIEQFESFIYNQKPSYLNLRK